MVHGLVRAWTTNDCPTKDRYDAWAARLNEAFGRWDASRPARPEFYVSLKSYDDSLLKVVECTCDPCAGTRTRTGIAADPRDTLTIQAVLEGYESIEFNGEQIVLTPGDLVVWDSTKPMYFNVQERLHKISVVLPLHRFQCWFPRSWFSIKRRIDGRSINGQLLVSYIKLMSQAVFDGGCHDDYALIDATIGMLVNALGMANESAPEPLRATQLRNTKKYIIANIREPSLCPAAIARSGGMSLRYLHWLFESSSETVMQYIIRNRLRFCVQDLSNPRMKYRKLADVAWSWGFHDVTYFSKRFKQEFGFSPRAFREQTKDPGCQKFCV